LEEDSWRKKSQLLPVVEMQAGGPSHGHDARPTGLIQVSLARGPQGFGLQIDRNCIVQDIAVANTDWLCPVCRVKVLASLHSCFSCKGLRPPSDAAAAGVLPGYRIVAVNGHATNSKSAIVSVLGDASKCPSRHVVFTFAEQ
jgi:hypothetical protein